MGVARPEASRQPAPLGVAAPSSPPPAPAAPSRKAATVKERR